MLPKTTTQTNTIWLIPPQIKNHEHEKNSKKTLIQKYFYKRKDEIYKKNTPKFSKKVKNKRDNKFIPINTVCHIKKKKSNLFITILIP